MENKNIEDITIKVSRASDEGYFYDIYFMSPEDITDDTESDDGGQCTSEDMATAIEMASSHAQRLLKDINDRAI